MSNHITADDSVDTSVTDALEELRVVDLSRFIAGPYCAMLLGDMGADFVKVEPRDRGENREIKGSDSLIVLCRPPTNGVWIRQDIKESDALIAMTPK